MTEVVAYGPGTLPPGVRSRFVSDINGLTMHVLEAGFAPSGRPCVLQDTGAGAHLPPSRALSFFSTVDEAAALLAGIEDDYPRACAEARQLAEEVFATSVLAVLGGIGNLSGAVVGGFLIGFIWSMSDGMVKEYITSWGAQWTNSVIFGILVIIMIFRPSGLLGEHTPEKV